MYIINGVVFGLVLSVLVGPVFFMLLQTSIQYGFKKALLVAIGISLSDIFYISLAYFGLAAVLERSGVQAYLGYGGGSVLILFGLASILKKSIVGNPAYQTKSVDGFYRFISRGLLVNGMSPFVLIFWLGTMSLATVKYAYRGYELLAFFVSMLLIVFGVDCLKAHLANKLRSVITKRLMKIINAVVGITLIGFGLRMFFYSW